MPIPTILLAISPPGLPLWWKSFYPIQPNLPRTFFVRFWIISFYGDLPAFRATRNIRMTVLASSPDAVRWFAKAKHHRCAVFFCVFSRRLPSFLPQAPLEQNFSFTAIPDATSAGEQKRLPSPASCASFTISATVRAHSRTTRSIRDRKFGRSGSIRN